METYLPLWIFCLLVVSAEGSSSSLKLKDFVKRSGTSRLSFKECRLDAGLREDCGYFGIDETSCYKRGCCWGESDTEAVPWCYHSKTTDTPQCAVDNLERVECGSYGIRKEQCLAKRCCWKPSSDNGAPWCFHYKRVTVFEGECGLTPITPNVNGMGRIVGGSEAKPHSWPWQISITMEGNRHCCGGSMINDQWIVTAAHCEGCLEGMNVVEIGAHDHTERALFQRTVRVDKIIPHENYNPNTIDNDVLLIKLSEKVPFGDTIQPVCLPKENQTRVAPGSRCYATGWGTTVYMGETPDKLQQVMLPIISTEVCNNADFYGNLSIGGFYDLSVTDNMICVGYPEGGRSACHGDSGGPLVCYDDDQWVLYGIASWVGRACAEEFSPTVYVRVSNYLVWMQEMIARYS